MVDPTGIETNPNRSYVDWPAIFAGAVISSGAMAILTAFAGGLGLSSISADDGGEISTVWLIITALFVIISMVGSYMLGGYIAGRMRRPAGAADRNELTVRDGVNGLVVWGLGTVVSAFLALGVLSGGAKAVGSVAQTAVEATGSAVGGAVPRYDARPVPLRRDATGPAPEDQPLGACDAPCRREERIPSRHLPARRQRHPGERAVHGRGSPDLR